MVYKKYIERNGKLYGPYIYHSKRVDGKVVSEYHGSKSNFNWKGTFAVIFGVFILAFAVYAVFSFDNLGVSGKVVSGLEASYSDEGIFKGKMNLVLNQGEFIPYDSKVIFENTDSGESYEYSLSDLISDSVVEGIYYTEDSGISGEGLGYGYEGERIYYPELSFAFEVYSYESSETGAETGGSGSSDSSENSGSSETPTEDQNSSQDYGGAGVNETQSLEKITTEENVSSSTEANPEEIVSDSAETNSEEIITEETHSEEVQAESTENIEDIETTGESSAPSSQEETSPSDESSALITGGVIKGVGRFFGITGRATLTLNFEREVSGTVLGGNDYEYSLGENETAELKHGSVFVIKTGEGLSDNEVYFNAGKGKVFVSTNYSYKESGYGEEFLGDKTKKFVINLDDLKMNFSEGNLNFRIVYADADILSINTPLSKGNAVFVEAEENPVEDIYINDTFIDEINKTEETNVSEKFEIPDLSDSLTDDERNILLFYFKNSSIETVKSEIYRGRLIIKYQIGNYDSEFSYDSKLNETIIETLMERDRVKWLKDISKSLSEQKDSAVNAEEYLKDYNF